MIFHFVWKQQACLLFWNIYKNNGTPTNITTTRNMKTCNSKWFWDLSHLFQVKHRSWYQKPTLVLRIQHPKHTIVLPHCSAHPVPVTRKKRFFLGKSLETYIIIYIQLQHWQYLSIRLLGYQWKCYYWHTWWSWQNNSIYKWFIVIFSVEKHILCKRL